MTKKIGLLVGEQGDWKFFHEIAADLGRIYEPVVFERKVYQTPLLYGRLNRWAFSRGIRTVLKKSDLTFFEWASELLIEATRMPKYGPIAVRLHSYELYAWAPHINWDPVDRIILVSQAMQRKFNALFPDQAHKTTVIYNAKPLDRFYPDMDRPFGFDLGMLCAFYPRKRIYEIVIAVHELRQKGFPARLHVAGGRITGPDLDEYYVSIQQLVDRLDLRDSVFFYDHITDTPEWLRQIDMFISNSYWEGHQVSLVEAMASGCYCLSHFWDGAEEVLPGDNLYIGESELQEKIIAYSRLPANDQKQLREDMRRLACEKFDLQDQLAQIRAVVAGLLPAG